jgi:hypothetical protein
MTELLINCLNNEIVLSKNLKDSSIDFHNRYLFEELLSKTKQIQNLSLYKNTNNFKDTILNFCHLIKNLNEIINSGSYTSKIDLYKIKIIVLIYQYLVSLLKIY